MPEDTKIEVVKTKLKYKDVFSLDELYKGLHQWTGEHGWRPPNDNTGDKATDHHEFLYLERVSGPVKEHLIKWKFEKKIPGSDYYNSELFIQFHTLAMGAKEAMFEGQKIKVNKGELEIEIKATLILDNGNKWRDHWFLSTFHSFFIRRIFRDQIEIHRKNLYNEMYELQGFVKQYWKLKQFIETFDQTPFHPALSFP